MTDPAADQAFERYLRTGEPAALGDLFDVAAPELLRVAHWLTGDLHAAEDVLQDCFLLVAERAEQHELGRPVLPWLVGITLNLAKRSRSHRRRARREDSSRLLLQEEIDPAEQASQAEMREALKATIDGLPEAYAQVLHLSLEHDLSAPEIARALRRSPGTIRSQLSRGMQLLRRALPAGFVAGSAVLVTPSTGLAAVRARVLSRVIESAAVATAAGGTVMATSSLPWIAVMNTTKVWITVASLAAVALAFFWLDSPSKQTQPQGYAKELGMASTVLPNGRAEQGLPPKGQAVERERVAASADTGSVITGRCVAAETGSPIADAMVVVRIRDASSDASRVFSELQTDAQGRFRVASSESADASYSVLCTAPGRVSVRGAVTRLDVGDIVLTRGPRLICRVFDADGIPVVHARLRIRSHALAVKGSFSPSLPQVLLRTEEDALLDVGRVMPGIWSIDGVPPFVVETPRQVEVTAGPDILELEVRLQGRIGRRVLRGRVIDHEGKGVAGVTVALADPVHSSIIRHAVSKDDGGFVVTWVPTSTASSAVLEAFVIAPDGYEEPPKQELRWGEGEVQFVLSPVRMATVTLVVRDAETGEQIDAFDAVCVHAHGHESPELVAGMPKQLVGVRSGPSFLTVVPDGDRYLPSETMLIEVVEGAAPTIEVLVHRAHRFAIRVIDTEGNPIANSRLELLRIPRWVREWNGGVSAEMEITITSRAEGGRGEYSYNHGPTIIDLATSDDSGIAFLRAAEGTSYAIRALGLDHAPALMSDVYLRRDASAPLDMLVKRGATLRGRVANSDGMSRLGKLTLTELAAEPRRLPNVHAEQLTRDGHWTGGASATMRIKNDGTFEIPGLPSGRWLVAIENFAPVGANPIQARVVFEEPLVLRAGQTTDLVLDGSRLRLGSITGRIVIEGERPEHSQLNLLLGAPDGRGGVLVSSSLFASMDARGRFSAPDLCAGQYRLVLVLKGSDNLAVTRKITDWMPLAPGKAMKIDTRIEVESLRLVLRDSDGELVPSVVLHLEAHAESGSHEGCTGRTDSEGVMRVPWLGAGEYSLRTLMEARQELGSIRVKASSEEQVFRLVMSR